VLGKYIKNHQTDLHFQLTFSPIGTSFNDAFDIETVVLAMGLKAKDMPLYSLLTYNPGQSPKIVNISMGFHYIVFKSVNMIQLDSRSV
jgi:hypothetical protein